MLRYMLIGIPGKFSVVQLRPFVWHWGGMGIVVELETFVAGLLESVVETMSVNSLHLTSRDQICSAEITE